jgi:hypothetical protein
VLARLNDVAALDQALQVLAHRVGVQPRRLAQLTDRAPGPRLLGPCVELPAALEEQVQDPHP